MPIDKAPFDQRGNLLHYPIERPVRTGTEPFVVWRPNDPFEATLTHDSTRRGRSAAYFIWRDPDDHKFPMFISDLAVLLRSTTIRFGIVRALWRVGKRGANYGVTFHAEIGGRDV